MANVNLFYTKVYPIEVGRWATFWLWFGHQMQCAFPIQSAFTAEDNGKSLGQLEPVQPPLMEAPVVCEEELRL